MLDKYALMFTSRGHSKDCRLVGSLRCWAPTKCVLGTAQTTLPLQSIEVQSGLS